MKSLQVGVIVLICLSVLSGCASEAGRPVSVSVAPVRMDIFSSGYSTVGVVKPETQVEVASKYAGTIERTFKEVGELVSAGETLVQLDTTPVMNQIRSTRAALEQTNATVAQTKLQYQTALDNAIISYDSALVAQRQTQNDYDNTKVLFEAEAIAKSALDAAQLALDKANAAVDTAKTVLEAAQKNVDIYIHETAAQSAAGADNTYSATGGAVAAVKVIQSQLDNLNTQLADYTVTSPIDGVIINKYAVAGAMTGQTPVYSVANIDKVIISTAVPKEEINKLSLGGNVRVLCGDNSFVDTQITAISNSANGSNLYMVQVVVDNKDHYFKPGMDAKMVFVESQYSSIIVPFDSVVNAGKDNYVFVAENDKATKVFVRVLDKNSDEISVEPIDADLNESTRIVTYNAQLLKDGDPIKVES